MNTRFHISTYIRCFHHTPKFINPYIALAHQCVSDPNNSLKFTKKCLSSGEELLGILIRMNADSQSHSFHLLSRPGSMYFQTWTEKYSKHSFPGLVTRDPSSTAEREKWTARPPAILLSSPTGVRVLFYYLCAWIKR